MAFNLLDESWLPVRTASGVRRLIRPDQIAEPDILWPDWPRPDLNIACLELLIGLVFLADPPENRTDWSARSLDPARLREKLRPLRPAFNLDGDGPRFMQSLEPFTCKVKPTDVLFIDSAGEITKEENRDIMVHADRYGVLAPGLAAITLYGFQTFAPASGPSLMTSLRGGGPMTTLVEPRGVSADAKTRLGDLVWANTPIGCPANHADLPWMNPPRVSTKHGPSLTPPENLKSGRIHPEVFFAMPRRIRLRFEDGGVVGLQEMRHGPQYRGWIHPLSPYRVKDGKAGEISECIKMKAGGFSYRNWLGVVMVEKRTTSGTLKRAAVVDEWFSERRKGRAELIVAGWAMSKAQPLDFTFSRQPLLDLTEERADRLCGMIRSADIVANALRHSLRSVLRLEKGIKEGKKPKGKGAQPSSVLDSAEEALFLRTQSCFDDLAQKMASAHDADAIAKTWRNAMRDVALDLFDSRALPNLPDRPMNAITSVVDARRELVALFAERRKNGPQLFEELDLPAPTLNPRKRSAP